MPKYPLLIRPDSRYEGPLYIDKKLLLQLFISSITVMAFLLNNYKISRHQRQRVGIKGYLVWMQKGQRADGLKGHNPGK